MNDGSKQAVVARRALTLPVDEGVPTLPTTLHAVDHELKRGKRLNTDLLAERLETRLDTINEYLTPDRLMAKLERANLNHIGIYEGILLDKLFLLRGQPTQIVGMEEHRKLDELMPALLAEIQRRGLHAKLTERTAEIIAHGSAPS